MKRSPLIVLAALAVAHPALASASVLYANSTVVGIGTTTPLNALEVYDGVIEGAQLAIGTTSTDGLLLANTTAATSGLQQYSPRVHFSGQGWKTNMTAASQPVDLIEELQPVSGGSAPSGNLVWSASINGGGYSPLMTLTSGGLLGIGTSTPLYSLDVNGGVLLEGGNELFFGYGSGIYIGGNQFNLQSTSANNEIAFN